MTDEPVTRIAPPDFLSRGAAAAVLAALPGARAVGGCVRDALAGRAIADIDVASPYPPEENAERLRAAGLKVFETGLDHGTVTAVFQHEPVEVTTLRRDLDTDGRHATVAWTTDWREDAARRDFTFNAMSLDGEGGLYDYFGGREDLAAGRVRFVGDAATRLKEDYLRALRFFRFWARYGHGAPDGEAIIAIRAAVPGLARLSAERVWMEIKRLLQAPDPEAALALMAGTGVLGAVLPEAEASGVVPRMIGLRRLVSAGAPADPVLRVAALLGPQNARGLGRLAARLRLSGDERDRLARLLGRDSHALAPVALDEAEARRFLAFRGHADALDEMWLAEAEDGQDRAAARALLEATPLPVFPLQGRDILDLGVKEGPLVGRAIYAARGWWHAGGCVATHEECLEEAKRLLADPEALKVNPGGR
ncbi:CCA tRNA nucleotidyltransferase [Acetobacteraceae bacterium H6797]|nr:CCA tRNA nucleotidyltransferase [Acetobacteraceae bacterium H6797]